jgi:heme A synthase
LDPADETRGWRPLRISVAITLVLLTIQGWTGDVVNLFVTTSPSPTVSQSFGGFFQSVVNGGPLLIWHGAEGILILFAAIGVLVISLRHRRRSVKIAAALGLFSVIAAALGGYLFVLSGFMNGGNSAQMGGSFIGSYAFFFLTLWYTK